MTEPGIFGTRVRATLPYGDRDELVLADPFSVCQRWFACRRRAWFYWDELTNVEAV